MKKGMESYRLHPRMATSEKLDCGNELGLFPQHQKRQQEEQSQRCQAQR